MWENLAETKDWMEYPLFSPRATKVDHKNRLVEDDVWWKSFGFHLFFLECKRSKITGRLVFERIITIQPVISSVVLPPNVQRFFVKPRGRGHLFVMGISINKLNMLLSLPQLALCMCFIWIFFQRRPCFLLICLEIDTTWWLSLQWCWSRSTIIHHDVVTVMILTTTLPSDVRIFCGSPSSAPSIPPTLLRWQWTAVFWCNLGWLKVLSPPTCCASAAIGGGPMSLIIIHLFASLPTHRNS